jgi:hypothetical protein
MYIGSDVWILWRVGGAFWIDDVSFECMGPRGVWGGLKECGFWGGGTMMGRDVRDSRRPLDKIGVCAGFFFFFANLMPLTRGIRLASALVCFGGCIHIHVHARARALSLCLCSLSLSVSRTERERIRHT